MKNRLLLLLGLVLPTILSTQIDSSIKITGIILESETKAMIPFANILLEGTGRGTVSNELGEFEIQVSTLPARLQVTHVGYKKEVITVDQAQTSLKIALSAAELEGVEVVAKRTAKIYQLITKALKRTREQLKQERFGKAFYRQVSKNDSIYSELYEIFYDTKFNANGITDWALQQGRYALQENNEGKGLVFNKNFTLIDRVFPTIDPGIDLFFSPISPRVEDFYLLRTEKIIQQDGKEIAVVNFSPKKEMVGTIPSMEGQVYIDMASFDILKLSGKFESNNLKVIAFRGEGKVDNYVLEYESSFQTGEAGELYLEYISAKQNFDVVYQDRPTKRVSTQSLLNIYEYYTPAKKDRKLGGRLSFRKSDAKAINQKGYDQDFWRENPIVKRTPVEEAVIADFEKNRQFGSIFLNNRNQVSFIPDIDADPFITQLLKQFQSHIPIQEKVYLQLDKPYYAKGETVWLKAYLVDASFHRPLNASKGLWVDLVTPEGEILTHQLLPVQGEGYALGDIKIGDSFPVGTYQIRAYTDRMTAFDSTFFFSQALEILGEAPMRGGEVIADDFEVTFFPEGGDLVNDLSSQLAFYAIDQAGEGMAVEGRIRDDQGKEIRKIKTPEDGRNSIIFQPKPGRSYTAELTAGSLKKQFAIPTALTEGYVMSVRNKKGKNLSVRVLSSPAKQDTEVYLVGQVRGRIYYKSKGKLTNRLLNFEIPRQLFPSGILQLSLMDAQSKIYAERLCFMDQEDALEIKIDPNKKKYNSREEVRLGISVKDENGEGVSGNFAIAVTDAAQVKLSPAASSIRNYLLLASDLKGNTSAPARYFDPTHPKAERQLDLLMLTNGWRRFSWQQVFASDHEIENPFFAQGFSVCGRLQAADAQKYKQADLAMVIVGPTGGFYQTQADDKGHFCFYDVNFMDTSHVLIQAIDPKAKTINLEVDMDWPAGPNSAYRGSSPSGPVAAADEMSHYQAVMKKRKADAPTLNGDAVLLDEVVVVGNKIVPRPSQSLHGANAADYVLDMEDRYESHTSILSVMEGKVPGLQIIDDGFRALIRITGGTNDPLVLYDGMPINQLNWTLPEERGNANAEGEGGAAPGGDLGNQIARAASANADDKDLYRFLRTLNPNTVDRIEVLRGANAAIYGVRGGNGVIAIYSKPPGVDVAGNLKGNQYPGYYSAREFYVPKYNAADAGLARIDRRATIYWNPVVQTDENGKAEIRFFNTDLATSFNIVMEGLSPAGQIGVKQLQIKPKPSK